MLERREARQRRAAQLDSQFAEAAITAHLEGLGYGG